jgi:hypothetical protein
MGKNKKENNTEQTDHTETEAVFRLKPQPHNKICEIKHVGYLKKNEQLGDEVVEIDTTKEMQEQFGKNVYHVGKFKGYEVFFTIYRTNMLGSYLINKSILPVYNISVMYQKNIVMGYLFDVFIFFDINRSSYVKLSTLKTIVNSQVDGRFMCQIKGDEELITNKEKLFSDIEEQVMKEIANNIDMNKPEEEIMKIYNKRVLDKRNYYTGMFDGVDVGTFTNNNKFVKDTIMPILKDDDFKDIINYAIYIREEKRRKELNAMEGEYKIPEKVIKLNEIKENPDKLKELL